jgi:purine-nucleoside phosphorylase
MSSPASADASSTATADTAERLTASTPASVYRQRVEEAAQSLRAEVRGHAPQLGIVVPAASAGATEALEVTGTVSCKAVPEAPPAAEQRLVMGRIDGRPVTVQQGTFPLHEGYTPREATFWVRVLAVQGITALLGVGQGESLADTESPALWLATDHLNLLGDNPLVGANVDAWGPRFPDMSAPYDAALREAARGAAEHGHSVHEGVYAATRGPQVLSPAERQALREVGADVAGSGLVPETLVARHMDVRVLGVLLDGKPEAFGDALASIVTRTAAALDA